MRNYKKLVKVHMFYKENRALCYVLKAKTEDKGWKSKTTNKTVAKEANSGLNWKEKANVTRKTRSDLERKKVNDTYLRTS